MELPVEIGPVNANFKNIQIRVSDPSVLDASQGIQKAQQDGETSFVLKLTTSAPGSSTIGLYYSDDINSSTFMVDVYDRDILQKKAEDVKEKINAIGEVTLESKEVADQARSAYNALEKPAREMVPNEAELKTKEAAYQKLKNEDDIRKANEVIAAIDAIGEVTLESEPTITDARSKYDALSQQARAAVSNYSKLKITENTFKKMKQNAEAVAAKAAEETSFRGACTAIGYTEAARNPEQHKGQKVKFSGKVIQAVEGPHNNVVLRVNVTKGNYDIWSDTIYVTYTKDSGDQSRILEDDIITLYGTMEGLKTYQTVLGGSLTIPFVDAKYIDRS